MKRRRCQRRALRRPSRRQLSVSPPQQAAALQLLLAAVPDWVQQRQRPWPETARQQPHGTRQSLTCRTTRPGWPTATRACSATSCRRRRACLASHDFKANLHSSQRGPYAHPPPLSPHLALPSPRPPCPPQADDWPEEFIQHQLDALGEANPDHVRLSWATCFQCWHQSPCMPLKAASAAAHEG